MVVATFGSKRLLQLLLLALADWAAMYSRSVMGPLQETIRVALHFSDNQMALLQGAAVALPMAACAIPLGFLADRFSRIQLLRLVVALMPVSCALSAIASRFALLFLARCLAGLSWAAVTILGFSIVGDLFSPSERGRASMVIVGGEILGAPVSFALGGTLLVLLGSVSFVPWRMEDWRATLLAMGALLIPIVLLMLLLREPKRTERVVEKPPVTVVWLELWRYRAVALPILLARAMVWLADGAVFVWAAPSFSRRFHLPPDRVGTMIGAVLLVSGLLGPILGGPLADLCQRHGGPRRTIGALAAVALISVPAAFFNFMPDASSAAFVMAIFLLFGFAIATAGMALSIIVIPGELRGVYLGASITVGSIFFLGLAPLTVSALSGALGGEALIGRALAFVCASASLMGAVVFAASARFFPRDVLDDGNFATNR